MVGMNVCFERKGERQAELIDDSEIAFDVFKDGIDDDGLPCIAIAHDVAAAFRSVVDVLEIVHVKQNGDSIGVADCHDMHSEILLRGEQRSAAILTCTVR